jgi:hypothetical protein
VPAAAVPPIVEAVIVVPYAGALTVTAPVAPETDTFVPATMLVTPLLLIDNDVVCDPDTLMPVPPATTGAVIVTAPVDALTLMPVPARLVTPVLLTVIVVLPLTEIAVPATMLFTPVAETVSAVVPDTLMPVPPLTLLTPVALTVSVVVPAIDTPVPAAIEAAIVGVVVPVTVMPLPAVTDVTPAAPPPLVPSGPDIVIRSPNRRR